MSTEEVIFVLKGVLFMMLVSFAASTSGVELTRPNNSTTTVNVVEPMVTPLWLDQQYQATEPIAEVKAATETIKAVAPTTAPVLVVVTPGDSLTSIAERYQTTFNRLFDANTEIVNPNTINVGSTIRIPSADEVLVARPVPAAVVPVTSVRSIVTPTPVSSAPAVASGSVWDQLARCESGGNWSINTGNGYYGGLQFSLSTWRAVGGSGLPSEYSREEQIARAEILLARSGWGQWPACTAKLGLR